MNRRQIRASIEAAFNQFRDIGFNAHAAFELAFIHVVGLMPHREILS